MIIRTVDQIADIDSTEAFYISYHWFNGVQCPVTRCRLCFVRDEGFAVRMGCEEKHPLARFTKPDEPVYKDSCMEFFADFFPLSGKGYLNFEVNANGAMLCMFERTRENRPFVKDLGYEILYPSVTVSDESWTVDLFIPLNFIHQVYGRCDFGPGSVIRGNFYKCGDETKTPHWGSWHTLGENPVDFHQPETFGEFVISDSL